MRLGLGKSILLPSLAVTLVGTAGLAALSYYVAAEGLGVQTRDHLTQLADSVSASADAWLADRQRDVATWSRQPVFRNVLTAAGDRTEHGLAANREAAQLIKEYPFYEDISLVDASGEIVGGYPEGIIGKINVKERAYFKEAMQGRACVSDVLRSKRTGNPIVVVTSPVRAEGRIVGTFSGIVGLASVSERLIEKVKVGQTGYAYMLNAAGDVIAHPDSSLVLELNISDEDYGRHMLTTRSGWHDYVFRGVQKSVAYRTSETTGWLTGVGAVTSELHVEARHVGIACALAGAGMAFILAISLWAVVRRAAVRPLSNVVGALTEGAQQVDGAAEQVAGASRQLAEGASEQAASLEETSSAMEEMSATTRANADNAKQAAQLSDRARDAAQAGDQTVEQLNVSMAAINQSSNEISKIIKVIEEIAFQTNLLALNAAVEAARAGEQGKGFAVVADEVRNLAQRAAQASGEVTGLIENSVAKAREGTEVAGEVGNMLEAIRGDIGQVADLVGGIAEASEEQASGVEQVNTAMTHVDRVTQQNAAGAEESASAAGQLTSQAKAVMDLVGTLTFILTGAAAQSQAETDPLDKAGPDGKNDYRAEPRTEPAQAPVAVTADSDSEDLASQMDPEGLMQF